MQLELIAGNLKEAMKKADAVSSNIWQVPVKNIHLLDGFNVRSHDAEHIAMLAASIFENGFYKTRPLAGYVAVVHPDLSGRDRALVARR